MRKSHTLTDIDCELDAREANELIGMGGLRELTVRLANSRTFNGIASEFYVKRDGNSDRIYTLRIHSPNLALPDAIAVAREIAVEFGINANELKEWAHKAGTTSGSAPDFELSNNGEIPAFSLGVHYSYDSRKPWFVALVIYWGRADDWEEKGVRSLFGRLSAV